MRDTIDMAREASNTPPDHHATPDLFGVSQLERFAALVRADERNRTWTQEHWTEYERSIAAAEREACAKVCDARYMGDNNREDTESRRCAAAIRARGNT
jgi:hypothetical protein